MAGKRGGTGAAAFHRSEKSLETAETFCFRARFASKTAAGTGRRAVKTRTVPLRSASGSTRRNNGRRLLPAWEVLDRPLAMRTLRFLVNN